MEKQQDQQKKPALGLTRRDKEEAQDAALAVVKGLVSGLPGVGPVVGELMGTVIPNRRMDRFEKMLAYFAARVAHLQPEYIAERMQQPEFVDLFEKGIHQSAKALIKERIASVGANLGSSILPDYPDGLAQINMDVIESLSDLELKLLVGFTQLARDGKSLVPEEDVLVMGYTKHVDVPVINGALRIACLTLTMTALETLKSKAIVKESNPSRDWCRDHDNRDARLMHARIYSMNYLGVEYFYKTGISYFLTTLGKQLLDGVDIDPEL